MKLWGRLLVGAGVAATTALVHGDANADQVEYASLVLGWEGAKVEWGMCVDKPSEAKAIACAKQRFEDHGGHSVEKQWVWTCHGFWAVAVSRSGRSAGMSKCERSLAAAKKLADDRCEGAAGKGNCVPVRAGHDGDNL